MAIYFRLANTLIILASSARFSVPVGSYQSRDTCEQRLETSHMVGLTCQHPNPSLVVVDGPELTTRTVANRRQVKAGCSSTSSPT